MSNVLLFSILMKLLHCCCLIYISQSSFPQLLFVLPGFLAAKYAQDCCIIYARFLLTGTEMFVNVNTSPRLLLQCKKSVIFQEASFDFKGSPSPDFAAISSSYIVLRKPFLTLTLCPSYSN